MKVEKGSTPFILLALGCNSLVFFYTIDKCYKVVAVTKVIFLKLLLISHSAGIKGRVSVSQTSFPPINKEVNKTSK